MRPITAARVIAIVYLILLTWIIWIPRPLDVFGKFAPTAQWLIGPGYWIHLGLYGMLGLLLAWAFGDGARARVAEIASIVCIHGVVSETGQAFVPGRHMDPYDLLCNLVGGALGIVVWAVARHRRGARASQ